jgi:hypothetical protein
MTDRNSQTSGSSNRSAIGGGDQTPKFGFPKSNLLEATRDLGGYVLIADDGRMWTSENDKQRVHDLVKQAGIVPETAS